MEYVTLILGLLQGLMNLAQGAAPIMQAMPGPIEKAERKAVAADKERLSGGAGGMSEGKLDLAQQRAGSQIQSAYQQGLAQLMRGGTQTGASGVQAKQASELMGQQAQALNQASAGVREMDLNEAARQRAELLQREWNLINQANARKAAYAGMNTSASDRSAVGAMGRNELASGVGSLSSMYGGSAASTSGGSEFVKGIPKTI